MQVMNYSNHSSSSCLRLGSSLIQGSQDRQKMVNSCYYQIVINMGKSGNVDFPLSNQRMLKKRRKNVLFHSCPSRWYCLSGLFSSSSILNLNISVFDNPLLSLILVSLEILGLLPNKHLDDNHGNPCMLSQIQQDHHLTFVLAFLPNSFACDYMCICSSFCKVYVNLVSEYRTPFPKFPKKVDCCFLSYVLIKQNDQREIRTFYI